MNSRMSTVEYARCRVKPDGPWIYMELCEVNDWMNDSDTPSGHYEVESVWMTPEEFEGLPEFEA